VTYEKKIGNKLLIGRDEWCQLPALHIPVIKAKIDTGAKTSAIHAFNIETFHKNHHKYVRFDIHPIQTNDEILVTCEAPIIDTRYIMSSNGHREKRFVIMTQLKLNNEKWPIEFTLSNRDPLRYRMLLGREALGHRVLIDPSLSCHQCRLTTNDVFKIYQSKNNSSEK